MKKAEIIETIKKAAIYHEQTSYEMWEAWKDEGSKEDCIFKKFWNDHNVACLALTQVLDEIEGGHHIVLDGEIYLQN